MSIRNRKFLADPVSRDTRLILGEKRDGPSKDKNRHTNQASVKQMHAVGLPPQRRNGPCPNKEEQGEVKDVKTVGESSESMGSTQVAMETSPDLELENAEQKQREGNSNGQVTTQHGNSRRSRSGETDKENYRREHQVAKHRAFRSEPEFTVSEHQGTSGHPNKKPDELVETKERSEANHDDAKWYRDAHVFPEKCEQNRKRRGEKRVVPEFICQAPQRRV